MPPSEGRLEASVKRAARDAGFSAAGISDLATVEASDRGFSAWLENGYHGEMAYLQRDRELRRHPSRLLAHAASALCVSLNYYTHSPPASGADSEIEQPRGTFSIYAQRGDYHRIMERALLDVDARLKQLFPEMRSLLCVDTKPVAERTVALQSGVGWLGKNTCVISPAYGSWIFLGVLLTDLVLKSDKPLESQCGDCTLCLDACPTGALVEPFLMDARKCISYLTIEKRGEIPEAQHRGMGSKLFGCDICQQVCPYNAAQTVSPRFMEEPVCELVSMDLRELAVMSNRTFERLTRGSTIRRCRPAGMRRNAGIALENLSR